MPVIVRDLSSNDSPKEIASYINELVDEDTFILLNRKQSVRQESAWLKSKIRDIKTGNAIHLVAYERRIVAIAHAERQGYKQKGNVVLGIAILKPYRGQGLGKRMLQHLIRRARQEMKPKNIYLTVFATNARAIKLYRKLGFRKVAVLPEWVLHKGRYVDEHLMLLKD